MLILLTWKTYSWKMSLFKGFCWLSCVHTVVFFMWGTCVAKCYVGSSGRLRRWFIEWYSVCEYVWFEQASTTSYVLLSWFDVLRKVETFDWMLIRHEIWWRRLPDGLAATGRTLMKRSRTLLSTINGNGGLLIIAHILFDYNYCMTLAANLRQLTL